MQWLCWKCLKSMALRGVSSSSGNESSSRSGSCRLVVGGSGCGCGSGCDNGSGCDSGSGYDSDSDSGSGNSNSNSS